MTKETHVANSALFFGISYFMIKMQYAEIFHQNIVEISTYLLIFFGTLFTFAFINHYRIFFGVLVGGIAFSSINLGIILAGTRGLSSMDFEVIDGLTRIVLAILIIWKLNSDMRNLKLDINPHSTNRSNIFGAFYGIIFPPRELLRILKILIFIVFSFYLVLSGLTMINGTPVDLDFLNKTEKIGVNLLFIGIQTPMMMSSRASISKTFSTYLKNVEWAEFCLLDHSTGIVNDRYSKILNSSEISYDSINSNGKHLWISVFLIILLQAFQSQIASFELENIEIRGYADLVFTKIKNIINSW
ncbi:MAG: hypothetical protein ACXAD7_06170 [Candidatus Kariarchaeaceae archaeon]|jgi:hypothetical protein